MKKKTLTERLNRYFSAEENAIQIPPIETIQAYNEFPAGSETRETPENRAAQARRPVQRHTRSIRRVAMVAACLAVVIVATVAISASISKPEKPGNPVSTPLASIEGAGGGSANQDFENSEHLGVSEGQEESNGTPSEGVDASDDPGMQEGPDNNSMGTDVDPDDNGNGMGGGGGEEFERYYPDRLFNLIVLLYIVTEDELDAAENKLLAENEYYYNEQLPSLYLFIRELNISKKDFVRAMDEYDPDYYTDEQIEWLFSDADIPTIQAAFKLDTALLYKGRLYNLYELLRLEPSQLREMADTEEMNAYFAGLDAHLEELERKALSEVNSSYHFAQWEWNNLSRLMNELKVKLESAKADSLDFSFCAAYTDELLPGGIFPYGNLILSSAELASYTDEAKQHDLFVLDRAVGDVPSYEHLVKKYDETWFETNSLVVLVVIGYEHQTPVVREVKKGRAKLIVYVDDSDAGGEQLYHIFIEVDSKDLEGCDNHIDIYQ